MAIVTGTAGVDFIHRAGDGRVPPQGTTEVTGVTTDSDAISALAGNDIIFGDAGDDAIDGGDGSDSIEGNTGNDIIVAGAGDDLIIWRNGDNSDIVDAGGNVDTQQVVMSDTAGDAAQLFSSGGNAVFQRLNLVPFTITMTNVERFDFQGLSGITSSRPIAIIAASARCSTAGPAPTRFSL
jgi:Ca2+-binding RTX toxin-like protein